MQKRVMRLLCLFVCAVWVIGGLGAQPVWAEAVRVDIGLHPAEVFMDVKNIKPGDTVTSALTIKNSGNTDITYVSKAEFSSGRKDFYELLSLEVAEGERTLYKGLLSGFTGFPAGKLKQGEEKTLQVTVGVPYEAGNEYQGAGAVYLFVFTASAATNPGGPDGPDRPDRPDRPGEPPTGGDGGSGGSPPGTPSGGSTAPSDPVEEPPYPDSPAAPPDDTPNITEEPPAVPSTPELPPQASKKNPPASSTGIPLPNTASPWFNVLMLSAGTMVASCFGLWRVGRLK
ncbi:hypothetical protein JQN58_08280 [Aneurinibacillus sp. BA2021]|nr:hypothetical protein [Aneurinibacillus sp. BA2021]